MNIKELLIESDAIQLGICETDWKAIINLAAAPLIKNGYLEKTYSQSVIDSTNDNGAYYVFDEGIAIPHARPECGVLKNCFSLVVLTNPVSFNGSVPADIIILFGAMDSNAHIEQGIGSIVTMLDDERKINAIRNATSRQELLEMI
ncbi:MULTISPECIES: PTS sugar transporter subunit IIA [Vibrio]|uniref:Ascorbate-specific PTS system EIIA component n=1 Tax=Vibrio casei TaxID=673372 RepID=A0A368LH02_9VIBR|nr:MULTISPECIES: PTS sugar transporter subunit IIA [Vibrio]RCS70032.1 PTS fructose transporter subunit IIA [Vibrio casei]SJN33918.1 Ascorbate-specific PTS system, EIIA component [Vibrio casei]HBV76753.1 PTS fructose transporter subunit IIA [Vibrio sp.]